MSVVVTTTSRNTVRMIGLAEADDPPVIEEVELGIRGLGCLRNFHVKKNRRLEGMFQPPSPGLETLSR